MEFEASGDRVSTSDGFHRRPLAAVIAPADSATCRGILSRGLSRSMSARVVPRVVDIPITGPAALGHRFLKCLSRSKATLLSEVHVDKCGRDAILGTCRSHAAFVGRRHREADPWCSNSRLASRENQVVIDDDTRSVSV